MSERRYFIQSIEAALDVVECLASAKEGTRGVTEISQLTGLKKNRVFRILTTLAHRNYVEQDDRTQEYRLGSSFVVVGDAYRKQLHLSRSAQPILRELARKSGDSAQLIVPHGQHAFCLDVWEGEHQLQAWIDLGEILPMHVGASPKILLAFLDKDERAAHLDQMDLAPYTVHTITSREALEQELLVIRERGYCVADGDYELGVHAIGAPVHDHSGRVIASITLTIPDVRYTPQHQKTAIGLVLEAARRVSAKLGYRESISSPPGEGPR